MDQIRKNPSATLCDPPYNNVSCLLSLTMSSNATRITMSCLPNLNDKIISISGEPLISSFEKINEQIEAFNDGSCSKSYFEHPQ